MNIKEFNHLAAIKKLYEEIYNSDVKKHSFQRIEILKGTDTIYYRFRWKSKVYYYVIFHEDNPVLIFSFRRINKETISLVGSKAGYDYCDIIWSDNSLLEKGIITLVEKLKSNGIRRIIWNFWDESSRSYEIFKKLNFYMETEMKKNTNIRLCFNSYDEYWNTLNKHSRQNIRTAYNRLNKKKMNLEFHIYDLRDKSLSKNFINEISKKYLKLYLERQSNKYHGSKFRHQLYLSKFNYITISAANPYAIMADITIDGELAAFMQGTLSSDEKDYEIPRLAINSEFNFFSPGIILVNETIKYIIENTKIENFNLCRGDEKYKYDMGGENYNTINCVISLLDRKSMGKCED